MREGWIADTPYAAPLFYSCVYFHIALGVVCELFKQRIIRRAADICAYVNGYNVDYADRNYNREFVWLSNLSNTKRR